MTLQNCQRCYWYLLFRMEAKQKSSGGSTRTISDCHAVAWQQLGFSHPAFMNRESHHNAKLRPMTPEYICWINFYWTSSILHMLHLTNGPKISEQNLWVRPAKHRWENPGWMVTIPKLKILQVQEIQFTIIRAILLSTANILVDNGLYGR